MARAARDTIGALAGNERVDGRGAGDNLRGQRDNDTPGRRRRRRHVSAAVETMTSSAARTATTSEGRGRQRLPFRRQGRRPARRRTRRLTSSTSTSTTPAPPARIRSPISRTATDFINLGDGGDFEDLEIEPRRKAEQSGRLRNKEWQHDRDRCRGRPSASPNPDLIPKSSRWSVRPIMPSTKPTSCSWPDRWSTGSPSQPVLPMSIEGAVGRTSDGAFTLLPRPPWVRPYRRDHASIKASPLRGRAEGRKRRIMIDVAVRGLCRDEESSPKGGPFPCQSGRFSQRPSTPTMPSRNSSTQTTKITPWMTRTQEPSWAR